MELDVFINKWLCTIEGEGGEGAGAGAGSGGEGAGGQGSEEAGGEGAGEGGGQAKPEPLTADAIKNLVNEQVRPLHEKLGELRSRNATLESALAARQQQPREVKAEPVKEPSLPTKEQFLEKMNADPVSTLRELIESVTNPNIEKRVNGAVSGTRAEQEAREGFMRETEGDRQTAFNVAIEWGDGQDSDNYEGSVRQEFDNMADRELRAIAASRGGRYLPGDLEIAANRAERKMRKAGKNPAGKGNSNGDGAGANGDVRTFPRNNPRSSAGAGGGGNGAGGPPTVAKTIDDLVTQNKLTKEQAEEAKKNNKKWGVTDADYVRNFLESEQENPRFGQGA